MQYDELLFTLRVCGPQWINKNLEESRMVASFLLRLNGAKNYKSGMVLFNERLLTFEKDEGNYRSCF